MKKRNKAVLIVFSLLILAGAAVFLFRCNQEGFTGSRVKNPDAYLLDIERMNGTDLHTLELHQGDVLQIRFETAKGQLYMEIKAPDGTTVYRGNGKETTFFAVNIRESGIYTVVVEARHAKGTIHIHREGGSHEMMQKIKEGVISDRVSERILWLSVLFFLVFFGTTILSYYLLPEVFLLGKNRISDFRTSENLLLCAVQIFLYNMLSVFVLFFGSAFAKRKEERGTYLSYGQVGFFAFILLNAVTLGTWSFTANPNSVLLPARLLRTFDIVHNAGLLEMYGQLLITSALATKYLVMTEGRKTTTRKIWEIQFSKSELLTLICGFLLMFTGALVESRAIVG